MNFNSILYSQHLQDLHKLRILLINSLLVKIYKNGLIVGLRIKSWNDTLYADSIPTACNILGLIEMIKKVMVTPKMKMFFLSFITEVLTLVVDVGRT